MRALLVYPPFPPSFWSYEPILRLVGKKALMPPLGEIGAEFVNAFVSLYDPITYLDRVWRYFLRFGSSRPTSRIGRPGTKPAAPSATWRAVTFREVRALLTVVWRQGLIRRSRWSFWHHLASILWHNPREWNHYLTVCAHNEHFLVFRTRVRAEISRQVDEASRLTQ